MSNLTVMKAYVVDPEGVETHGTVMKLALLNPDGTPLVIPEGFTPAEAVADSEATTVEELVVDFNSLLAALRDAGILLS